MTKKDLMEELLDRYQQLQSINKNDSAKVVLELYIKELEFRLIKKLEER